MHTRVLYFRYYYYYYYYCYLAVCLLVASACDFLGAISAL